MRRLVRLAISPWHRASFSLKFALVLIVVGALMAAVPLLIAVSDQRSLAEDRALDKAGIAGNLVRAQRDSLTAFATGLAGGLVRGDELSSRAQLITQLTRDFPAGGSDDMICVSFGGATVLVRNGIALPDSSLLSRSLLAAAGAGEQVTAVAGIPWLLAHAALPRGGDLIVARPVTARLITVIRTSLDTGADRADLAVLAGGRYAVAGTVAGRAVADGAPVDPPVLTVSASGAASVAELFGVQVASATTALGGPYVLLVTTPLDSITTLWQVTALVLGSMTLAISVMVTVVRSSLQRPLRRLDRAVGALSHGDFDAPVHAPAQGELGRLAATFERMRRRLRTTLHVTEGRAAIAARLNEQQPLEKALQQVCGEMRRSLEADAALMVVSASEMADAFAVADGVPYQGLAKALDHAGPLGAAFRHGGASATVLCAVPGSIEHRLGLRELCLAPLLIGSRVLGVVAVARRAGECGDGDVDLMASTAEQVALAVERYRVLAVVQHQASVDHLTGLHNHRFLVEHLGQQLALAQRLGTSLAVLMLDIDHFKSINDTHGHQAGDAALRSFAQTLTGSIRRSDFAARYGGEEFVVVMPDTSAKEARIVAEKIRKAVERSRVLLDGDGELSFTVSTGVAAFPEDTRSAGALLTLADQALYLAKRSGRNRSCMASQLVPRRRSRRRAAAVVHTPAAEGTTKERVGAGRLRRSSQ